MAIAAGVTFIAGCGAAHPVTDRGQVRRGIEAVAGISQDGFTLGNPKAPWTLSVISSSTSFELDYMIGQLPELTDRFVRPGRLNLQMRTPTKGPYGANAKSAMWPAYCSLPAFRIIIGTHGFGSCPGTTGR